MTEVEKKETIEEAQEDKEEPVRKTRKNVGALFTPEGVVMMFIAAMLDLTGLGIFLLSLLGIGIPLSFLLDITGLLIIGGWTLLRSGSASTTKQAAKLGKKAFKRLGLGFLGELVPFFGDIAFCWTLVVYLELTR